MSEANATPSRFQKISAPSAEKLHPLVRTFCPAAAAAEASAQANAQRNCVCPILLLMVPLAVLLIGLATGSLFEFSSKPESVSQWNTEHAETLAHATEHLIPIILLIAGIAALVIAAVSIAKHRHNAFPAKQKASA